MVEFPLVIIRCTVYNHELYLRQCLDGFVMQKTNFPFYAVVHDDASTDGSADIIREYTEKYPDIIHPIYEVENQYSKHNGSLRRIMDEACKIAKYIAICEGDDYWIDEYKLQKQVDYLETHPECGLVHTLSNLDKDGRVVLDPRNKSEDINTLTNLLLGNLITTCTVIYRKNIVDSETEFMEKYKGLGWPMGDYPLWITIAMNASIHLINEVTANYRILSESASHSNNKCKMYAFDKATIDIKSFFYDECIKRGLIQDKNYELRFAEMDFHARKRMLLDYKWIAREQIWPLLCTPLDVWRYMIKSKLRRQKARK